MTPKEFIEKYDKNPAVTIAFGVDYIVVYDKNTYQDIDRVDCPQAGTIAYQLLIDAVKRM